MNAYWDAVWQIAGIMTVFGLCLAVAGALVIGAWLGVRHLSGEAASPQAVLGTGWGASGSHSARPRAVAVGGARSSAPSSPAHTIADELPPPDSMGRTPKSALAERSSR